MKTLEEMMESYRELEARCRVIAKQFLDATESGGKYYGHVQSIMIHEMGGCFEFNFLPSTSGIGGIYTLPLYWLKEDEKALKEIMKKYIEKSMEERRKEREANTCKCCGNVRRIWTSPPPPSLFHNPYDQFVQSGF